MDSYKCVKLSHVLYSIKVNWRGAYILHYAYINVHTKSHLHMHVMPNREHYLMEEMKKGMQDDYAKSTKEEGHKM